MTSTFLESIHKTRNNSTAGLASYWSIALHDTGYRAFCWDPRPDAINALIRQRHITRKYNGITDNEIEIMNTEFQKLKPEMDRFVESWKQLTKFEPLTMVQDIALPHKYHLGFRVVDTISTASHTVSNYMATISTTKENNPEYYQKRDATVDMSSLLFQNLSNSSTCSLHCNMEQMSPTKTSTSTNTIIWTRTCIFMPNVLA